MIPQNPTIGRRQRRRVRLSSSSTVVVVVDCCCCYLRGRRKSDTEWGYGGKYENPWSRSRGVNSGSPHHGLLSGTAYKKIYYYYYFHCRHLPWQRRGGRDCAPSPSRCILCDRRRSKRGGTILIHQWSHCMQCAHRYPGTYPTTTCIGTLLKRKIFADLYYGRIVFIILSILHSAKFLPFWIITI